MPPGLRAGAWETSAPARFFVPGAPRSTPFENNFYLAVTNGYLAGTPYKTSRFRSPYRRPDASHCDHFQR